MQNIKVTKRSGKQESIDLDKIHRVITWAAENLDDVSVSQVELNAQIQFEYGITTYRIHETIIKAAADLISEDTPDYQYLAARLAIFHLRKRAYGRFSPPSLFEQINKMVRRGVYGAELLTKYTKQEFEKIDKFIVHERDLSFSYAGVKQMEGKYLVQNRVTQEIYESPQFLYVLVAAILFAEYPKNVRLDYVKRFYDATSMFKISLPTPIMAGVRTKTRQFSSCVLIETDDSLNAINATSAAVIKYVSQRAGIGVNIGKIRAKGSPIRDGEAYHTGVIPFIKHFQTAVKSCSQGGVRGGAATLFYPIWHYEVEELVVLKNNRGVDENRARHLDYGIQINKLMYQRLLNNGNITLFSSIDVPNLYESFFKDQKLFNELYEQYEQDEKIRKKVVKATDLFGSIAAERANTGRLYIQHVDHCNTHSSFDEKVAPIHQSNLCMEITLPTRTSENFNDKDNTVNGEIGLCTLAAFNLGSLENLDELENLADLSVRALDSLLSYQDYPLESAKHALARRSLGIGVINYANYLAKNLVKYSDDSAKTLTHKTFEAIQYYCIKASMSLAKEKGRCDYFHETKYAQGILPIDTYKKELDEVATFPLQYDWETLRKEVIKHGLRNSTLTALMPSESSSQVSNATNGIEPPRGFVSVKQSKDGLLKQVVPNYKEIKQNYELLWSIPDNKGYLTLVGIMQKFIDQAISANTNYDPQSFKDNKVPVTQVLKDMLYAYKLGVKTLYYHNTRDGSKDKSAQTNTQSSVIKMPRPTTIPEQLDENCESGACAI